MPAMLNLVMNHFESIPDSKTHRSGIRQADCLMSGLALFSLKYPSLLQFDNDRIDGAIDHNLKSLFKIKQIPSDTFMRECLDDVKPEQLRKAFTKLFAQLQRGNELKTFQFMEGYYLLSIDGTGFFNSNKVHCEQCCEKHHKNGSTSYYHQMLGAALVHPDHHVVLPLAPEAIIKQDGVTKNDCERNASKRLLAHVRREHPHLKTVVLEDGLSSNAPHINDLKHHNMRFILGAKPGDHHWLFNHDNYRDEASWHSHYDDKGTFHYYRYINNVSLNESNQDCKINFLEYREITKKGKRQRFSWVTDLTLSADTVYKIMRGGRARWRIENETFNTLKNQGYHFEHNFGHGQKELSTVMAYLMMLAFLIDQMQGLCSQVFLDAVTAAGKRKYFWERLKGKFNEFLIDSWEELYQAFIHPPPRPNLVP
jgi:hypothetical protein